MINIENVGDKTGNSINVELSYKIVELFSGGLYSSPNKAFEELVTNAYDADAPTVAVGVPSDIDKNDFLWVLDDGSSMDSSGFQNLWKIGDSNKRNPGYKAKRRQIGKFGIGILATYILTNRLSYICKAKGKYLAVTMDYSWLDKSTSSTQKITLKERELKQSEAKEVIEQYTSMFGIDFSPFKLFGGGSKKTWTFCIMTRLKPKAKDISIGRLKWVLRTALPLNPGFRLYFNGEELKSSKISNKVVKKWVIGKTDEVVKKNDEYETTKYEGKPAVNLPHIKNVWGSVTFYENSFATGTKSEEQGRSHGIFLMVRERLINLDDALLGMGPFAHGAFNRTRMVVHADELDDDLTSTRESIKESPAYSDLKKYLTAKFNILHSFYLDDNKKKDLDKNVPYKISKAAYSLTRAPLYSTAVKCISGEVDSLVYVDVPEFTDEDDASLFLDGIKDDLESDEGIIQSFDYEFVSPILPFCRFDLESRTVHINKLHPYAFYLLEEATDSSFLQMTATMEILLEAQMIEEGLDNEKRKNVLVRRDQTLRNLCLSDPQSAAAVAQAIGDAESDETGLEKILVQAFNILGFEAVPIGKSGNPDGLAIAQLPQISKEEDHSYKVTLEAKSTKHKAAKSTNIDILTIEQHRKDYNADFAIVVARDFEGGDDEESKICKNAKDKSVTLLRTKDLSKLVYLAGPHRVNLYDFREFFENCITPSQTAEWISNLEDKEVVVEPYHALIDLAHKMQFDDTEPLTVQALRVNDEKFKKYSSDDIKRMLRTLEHQVPGLVSLNGNVISINQKPAVIKKALKQISIPPEFRNIYKKSKLIQQ